MRQFTDPKSVHWRGRVLNGRPDDALRNANYACASKNWIVRTLISHKINEQLDDKDVPHESGAVNREWDKGCGLK